jgi:hypothetical protein
MTQRCVARSEGERHGMPTGPCSAVQVSNKSPAVTLREWPGLGPDGFVHPMGLWQWWMSDRIILLPLG